MSHVMCHVTLWHQYSQTVRTRTWHFETIFTTPCVSCVMCRMYCLTCHMSRVSCQQNSVIFLGFSSPGKMGGANRGRVCYQWDLPRNFWGTFSKVQTFGTFEALLCVRLHTVFGQKVPQNFWIWSTPSPFSTPNSKNVCTKTAPQLYDCIGTPNPLYGRKLN